MKRNRIGLIPIYKNVWM